MTKSILLHSKYLLLVIIALVAAIHSDQYQMIVFALVEVLLLFAVSNLLLQKHKVLGYIANCIFSFVFLLQQGLLFFSGEYFTQLMFENLGLVDNLGDMLFVYTGSAVVLLLIAMIPIKYEAIPYLNLKKLTIFLIPYLLVLLLIFSNSGVLLSPFFGFGKTVKNIISANISRYRYGISSEDRELYFAEFYRDSIERSNVVMEKKIPENPNVILIFVEGLSMNVIDIANNLNLGLTPHLNEFYKKSLVFENYYNQTAPTLAGIRGQLFSGFNKVDPWILEDEDNKLKGPDSLSVEKKKRTRLISLVDVLKECNYETTFINVESDNRTMDLYYKQFYFDRLVSGRSKDRSVSDKDAYELLTQEVKNAKSPFFISMYSLGTHHGHDSPDVKYGDGKNPVLNKFHNLDAQFGLFFDELEKTDILDNTILILTTDHASYYAPEFRKVFTNTSGYFIDKIPLMIYWKGVKHELIDAKGRNTIDLTPTVLDMMGISHNNYFLGASLFLDRQNIYNTHSLFGDDIFYTGNSMVDRLKKIPEDIRFQYYKYHNISYYFDN